jgi:hypothetical protein
MSFQVKPPPPDGAVFGIPPSDGVVTSPARQAARPTQASTITIRRSSDIVFLIVFLLSKKRQDNQG